MNVFQELYAYASDLKAISTHSHHNYHEFFEGFNLPALMRITYPGEALDMVSLDKFAWGCDTWTAEEGYGALLAVRQALAEEFSRRVEKGLMDISAAKRSIRMILRDNPKALYRL